MTAPLPQIDPKERAENWLKATRKYAQLGRVLMTQLSSGDILFLEYRYPSDLAEEPIWLQTSRLVWEKDNHIITQLLRLHPELVNSGVTALKEER